MRKGELDFNLLLPEGNLLEHPDNDEANKEDNNRGQKVHDEKIDNIEDDTVFSVEPIWVESNQTRKNATYPNGKTKSNGKPQFFLFSIKFDFYSCS